MVSDRFMLSTDTLVRMEDAARRFRDDLEAVSHTVASVNRAVNHCGPDTMAWEGSAARANVNLEDAHRQLNIVMRTMENLGRQVHDRVSPTLYLAGAQPEGSPFSSGRSPGLKPDVRAEMVPIDDSRNTQYYRGDGTTKSNCTWYATEAVKVASGGRVDLGHGVSHGANDGLGDATDWVNSAESYVESHPGGAIKGVDGTPRAGDVIWFNYGHVAYVESVTPVGGGKVQVVISEENYYGSPMGTGEQIGNEYRWRRTLIYDPSTGTSDDAGWQSGVRFIHPNYDYQGPQAAG